MHAVNQNDGGEANEWVMDFGWRWIGLHLWGLVVKFRAAV
jgi:hypothetical protein